MPKGIGYGKITYKGKGKKPATLRKMAGKLLAKGNKKKSKQMLKGKKK